MNTYVDERILTVGMELDVFDPNTGEEVTLRVISSGWTEKGGCACHPQSFDMFEAQVVQGFSPGRVVRGYTESFDDYDPTADEVYETICVFILRAPDLDEVARDLRLAREGKMRTTDVATLERIMTIRGQLQLRGWSADYIRDKIWPTYGGSLSLGFFESCGNERHRGTGWLCGIEVIHDGYLVKTPGATTWDSPAKCGCVSSSVNGHTVARHRGYPQVYVTAAAEVSRVEEYLRAGLGCS